MGFLGILFEREYDKPLLLLVEKKEVKKVQIIGFLNSFPESYELRYITLEGGYGKFLFFEESSFVYSKIAINDQKVLDYDFRTFWFGPKEYKILRDLLYIQNHYRNDYLIRISEALLYF